MEETKEKSSRSRNYTKVKLIARIVQIIQCKLQKTCKDWMTSLLNERFHSQEKWNLLRVSKITHGLTPQAAPKINEQSPQFPFTPVKNSKCFTCNSFQDYQTKRVTYNICSNGTKLSHKIHANQETDDPNPLPQNLYINQPCQSHHVHTQKITTAREVARERKLN